MNSCFLFKNWQYSIYTTKNKRKFIYFEELSKLFGGDTYKLYFIEGVGTSFGIGFYLPLWDAPARISIGPPRLVCSYKNDSNYFINSGAILLSLDTIENNCFSQGEYHVGFYNGNRGNEVRISPIPAENQVNIEVSEFIKEKLELDLFNQKGQKINTFQFNNNLTIKRNNKPGIYFYRLTNKRGELIKTGKIIFAE